MKNLKYMLIVAIAIISNLGAQAQSGVVNFKDSAEYKKHVNTGNIVSGQGLTIDFDYMDLSDQFGGKPWDSQIKKGVGVGTIITGWYVGAAAAATSDVKNIAMSPKISLTAGNYFGWGDVNVNVGITQGMKFAGESFNALSSSLGIEITLLHFGGKRTIDTQGLSEAGIKRALKNEKYSRMWRLFIEGRVGYQYVMKNTKIVSGDDTADFTGTKDGSSVSYGASLGLEKRFMGKLSRVGLKVGGESFQFKSYGESFQPVYGSATVYIKFGLGRRPNGGKF